MQTFGRKSNVLKPRRLGSRKVPWVPSTAVTSGRAAKLRVTVRAGSRIAHATLNVTAP